MSKLSTILGPSGKPFDMNGKTRPRFELAEAFAKTRPPKRQIEATYDAARTLADTANHWADADRLDADSANSREVRATLVSRSRHEIGNNGYSDGIAQTYATDVVGSAGPILRMQTGSTGFNRLIESEWYRWCKAVQFRRKLWCMAHAKHGDGEGIGVARLNPNVRHAVKFDLAIYETEQLQTPLLAWEPGAIDGMQFDEFGSVEYYNLLHHHPGSAISVLSTSDPERVRPEFLFLWFKLRRPGQHRGVPEMASTLNLGAAARRWREATLTHAEMIARLTLLLTTRFQPQDLNELNLPQAMSTLEIAMGQMQALPDGVDPHQLDAKQPAQTYEMFAKSLISEQARPKNMPRNKAAADSSDYNYASGRLDHQTYYGSLDVDREDCNDLVLDPLFDLWFNEAVRVFGWLGGNPELVSDAARAHAWDWPKHPVADVSTEASANDTNLKNGSLTLPLLYASNGEDFEDSLIAYADSLFGDDAESGLTPEQRRAETRKLIRQSIFNAQNQQASMQQAETQAEATKQAGESAAVTGKGLSVLDTTLALQKIYLAVGKVISAEEAREILNRGGANLSKTLPEGLPSVPFPTQPFGGSND